METRRPPFLSPCKRFEQSRRFDARALFRTVEGHASRLPRSRWGNRPCETPQSLSDTAYRVSLRTFCKSAKQAPVLIEELHPMGSVRPFEHPSGEVAAPKSAAK